MNAYDKLKALIASPRFKGNQAAFARAIARNPSQVNQWLSGYRKLDLKGQKIIEDALSLPGYFESSMLTEKESTYAVKVIPRANVTHPAITEIVTMLNNTDDHGKAMALGAVKAALSGYIPAKANHSS